MKILKQIIKRAKISNLILLIILLSFNTYAWFVYSSTVSSGLTANILAWDIYFTTGGTQVSYMNFNVSDIYPGMTTYSETLEIINRGDVAATIVYEIQSIEILGITYALEGGETAQTLEERLLNYYPFSGSISVDNLEMVGATDATSAVTVEVAWPFESGDDELDSYWGNQAYTYIQEHPTEPCVEIVIKFTVTQAAE